MILEFFNSLHPLSIIVGVLLAFIGNLIVSVEQYVLEKWAVKCLQKKNLKKE